MTEEIFGPVLHVVRWTRRRRRAWSRRINALGYGLTLGIQTRIDSRADAHRRRGARIGNVYVNRNMIGAVVGVQPFGGEGLSRHRARRPAARTTCCASAPSRR